MVLNADNCVGQNKNNSVLQYMMWRVATGMNSLSSWHSWLLATQNSVQIMVLAYLNACIEMPMLTQLMMFAIYQQIKTFDC